MALFKNSPIIVKERNTVMNKIKDLDESSKKLLKSLTDTLNAKGMLYMNQTQGADDQLV